MDGFSYSDIFATKGAEYLVIIAFLLLLVPFWMMLNKREKAIKAKKAADSVTADILRIPQGIFYSKNHTWMHLEKSGSAKVGLDDLLLHITGEVRLSNYKTPGELIRKGELLAEIEQEGKSLRVLSPVSGIVTGVNPMITTNPGMLNEDPYEKGWICSIKPSKWILEADACYFAEEAAYWSKSELERYNDFLSMSLKEHSQDYRSYGVIMQDGGALVDHSLSSFPKETWKDFEKEFLMLREG